MWILRLKSGDATLTDAEAFSRWRAGHPDHDAAFREAVRTWRLLGPAAQVVSARAGSTPNRRASRTLSRRTMLIGSLAASVAAVGILSARPPLGIWPSIGELAADFRTSKGERRRITLSSDVVLDLNTQTSLSRGTSTRHFDLVAGEAIVTCRRSGTGPVEVAAGDGRILADEAGFAVRRDGRFVTVTCLSGDIDLHHHAERLQLGPGQQAGYSSDRLGPVTIVDPDATTSWISGLLVFKNQTLGQVIDEVNRYRPGRIVVINSDVARRLVNATFHLDRLDDVTAQIRDAFGVTITTFPGGLVLLG
ncbi:fec operon regulator FecR [Blastochloris viridis]|nr:fec operon regulator FecR [Blastochloris viridis]CUU42307.1 fec operon regulator FecR [Blastochloris viridis]